VELDSAAKVRGVGNRKTDDNQMARKRFVFNAIAKCIAEKQVPSKEAQSFGIMQTAVGGCKLYDRGSGLYGLTWPVIVEHALRFGTKDAEAVIRFSLP